MGVRRETMARARSISSRRMRSARRWSCATSGSASSRAEPGEEALELLVDRSATPRHLVAPPLEVALDQLLERVEVVEEDVAQPPASGSTLRGTPRSTIRSGRLCAGASPPRPRRGSGSARARRWRPRPGRGAQRLEPRVERHRLGVRELAAEGLGALRAAVGEAQPPAPRSTSARATGAPSRRRRASAPSSARRGEDALRELDRRRSRGRPRPRRSRSRRAPRAPAAAALRAQRRTSVPLAPERFGERGGLLHLAEHLGLAQHHRLEPAGDRQQVPRRVGAALDVERPSLSISGARGRGTQLAGRAGTRPPRRPSWRGRR